MMVKEKFGCYLVCKKYLEDVKKFLNQFLDEIKEGYESYQWVTFHPKNSDFKINLMKGEKDEPLTHYFTFEIYFNSEKELKKFAKKYKRKIKSFKVTNTKQKYIYHYVEIMGPKEICKIEASYSENIK
jgi:hypothetical protein